LSKYILKRFAISAATLGVILLLLFLLLQFMPGSPFNDEKLSPDQIAAINTKYGLDKPIPVRFLNYVLNMLKGDFGVSYTISKNTPVSQLLATRLVVSFRIGGQAVLLGAFVGLLLGVVAAVRHGTVWDTISTIISVLGVSLPSYVFALTLSYSLGFRLGIFPLLYKETQPLLSSVMPTISLCMFTVATIARFTRTELLEVLDSDYMLLAESKGISGVTLFVRHALRNALIPIVTVLAPLIVNLMTGSLVVEKIFSIPGIGSLLINAIQANDYNVIITIAFVYSAMYILIMFVLDILYGVIDPRIRVVKGAERA
jgi:oligopeptide transport system permease protein